MQTSRNFTVVHRDDLPRDNKRFADSDVSFIWVDMSTGDTQVQKIDIHVSR